VIRAIVDAARYQRAMRRALRATRNAVDRGGRTWTREDFVAAIERSAPAGFDVAGFLAREGV
jgi:hypothetical protein